MRSGGGGARCLTLLTRKSAVCRRWHARRAWTLMSGRPRRTSPADSSGTGFAASTTSIPKHFWEADS